MFFSVCLIVFCLNSYGSAFIVPKLLLPYYDKIQVNYTIQADEGCYRWSSQNFDVASIQPISKDGASCTTTAVVIVQSKSPSRRITLILAENEITGTVLQCDVIVDRIVNIDIVSRTRELFLDDPPETLHIRALDNEGNTFSSTAYMLFDWKLLPDEDSEEAQAIPPHRILNIGKFIETDYTAEPYVEQLERRGLQSDTILLSGLQTGTAYVVSRLPSSSPTMTAKIGIIVRDKVFLIPNGVVWIPRYGMIQFKVEKWRNGKPAEVQMPHQQYFLQLSENAIDEEGEDDIVSLDKDKSVVVGLVSGNVQLLLMDRNLKQDTVQDSCEINVVEPAYIRFSILPDDRWVLETGRYYIILVHMYDSDNHKLHPGSNVRISTTIDPLYFRIIHSTANGTWHSVEAIQKGVTELYAKLNGIIRLKGDVHIYHPVIETTQTAEIFDPITVRPPIVVFPWQPKPVLYKYKLRAKGGSGNYTWSINNATFASVSSNGMITTKVGPEQERDHQPDSAVVRATDVRNPAHWGSADVLLEPAIEILFARSYREAQIETDLDLYLTMHAQVDGVLVPVVDCRRSGIKWKIQDSSIFRILQDVEVPIPDIEDTIACTGLRLRALSEGYTVLSAHYIQALPSGQTETMTASVTIAAFPPLKAIDPVSVAVVSLDSSKLLRFRGGPLRWPLWQSGFVREVPQSNNITDISPVQSSHHEHQVVARCRRLGDSKITLKVFNRPCNTNPMPVEVSTSVRVLCDVPHHLQLMVSSLLPTCPLHRIDMVQTVALMERNFSINLTVYNDLDLPFDNFSSLHIEWKSHSSNTDFIADSSSFSSTETTQQREHIVTKTMMLPAVKGEQIISVSLTKYTADTSGDVCEDYDCRSLEPVVSGSVAILVVSPPVVSPSSIILFNHENFSATIRVDGGSGYFDFDIEQTRNITAVASSDSSRLKLIPIRPGTATLLVVDLCLALNPAASTDVSVVGVGRLLLKAPPRVALDSSIPIQIEAEDNLGRPLPPEFFPYLNLHVESSVKEVLAVGVLRGEPGEVMVAVGNITGTNVGMTMLTAVSKARDGELIRSNAVHVVVISPLELHPPSITLIKHAEYQLRTVGGPRTDFTMKFTIEGDDIGGPVANISQSGVVHALRLGSVRISAQAVMHDGYVFHSRRSTQVDVVRLTGIRIDTPLTQYHVGGTIPLHVNSVSEGGTPMSFGSAFPGLIFNWESANPSVCKLHTVHSQAGIETDSNLSFSVLAEGVSSGHCVITVVVTAEDSSLVQLSQKELQAEISLMVYDPLAIVSTDSCVHKQWKSTSKFLITPSTSHHLQTNRDGVAHSLHFTVLNDQKCTQELLDADEETNDCISVDAKGVLTSGPHQCQATILLTSVERFGLNQSLALHILVRPVAYVIARAVTEFRTRDSTCHSTSFAFPLSASVKFVVDQFDDAADKFDATSHDVMLNLNRYDRVEVEPESGNRSFNLRLPLEGTTVMSVESYLRSTTTPSSVYYFPIHVRPALQPQEQRLTIGLKFCFQSEFVNLNGSDGVWSGESPKVLVAPRTGAVVAVARSSTEVNYVVNNLEASAQVSSVPFVASLSDGRLSGPILSRYVSYSLPIKLQPCYQYSKFEGVKCGGLEAEMNELASRLFVCSVRFANTNIDDVYSARPEFSAKTGQYACVITRRDLTEGDRKMLATVNDTLVVSLRAASDNLGSVQGGLTILPFHPSFFAQVASNNLVPGSYVMLCITGTESILESVKIIPCDANLLDIPLNGVEPNGANCYRVSTRNKDPTIRSAYFRVVSHLTEQDEKIDLNIDRVAGRLMSSSSPCTAADRTLWRGATDMLTDTYLAYLSSLSIIIISAALLLAAFTAYRWVSNTSLRPSSSFFARNAPPPYDPNTSFNTTPRSPGSPGSTQKPRLWSRYYQPQQASPSTG